MSGSRFAQLSLVDALPNNGGHLSSSDEHDPDSPTTTNASMKSNTSTNSNGNNKKKKKRNQNNKKRSRSSLFTWSVLMDKSLNRTVPRGLVNRSNFCYLNAVLQPLLLCQPFTNIIMNLQEKIKEGQYRWLSAFLELASAFCLDDEQSPGEGASGDKFQSKKTIVNPECVYKCWDHSDDQEDAEEFLRLILNGIHEELLANKDILQWDLPTLHDDLKSINKQTVEDEWICVKKGQKAATSRLLLEPPTPISVLFYGQFKSIVRQQNQRESHVYEPFQFLPLDVNDDCTDLTEAIHKLMLPEQLNPKTSRQLLIDRLPPILVIQLKRFVFDAHSYQTTKSLASIHVPAELDLSDQVEHYGDSVFFKDNERPVYRLTAVVYHLGRSTHGGHYTCHVLHDDTWYHCDDGAVQPAPREVVGQTDRNRTPYLLFYSRLKGVTVA